MSVKLKFPKKARVRTRRQFLRISQQATKQAGRWIVIDACPGKNLPSRLGITVSRRYGKAVQRNRFKRIVREAFRLCRHQLKPGYDFNVRPRNAACHAKTGDIMAELLAFYSI